MNKDMWLIAQCAAAIMLALVLVAAVAPMFVSPTPKPKPPRDVRPIDAVAHSGRPVSRKEFEELCKRLETVENVVANAPRFTWGPAETSSFPQ